MEEIRANVYIHAPPSRVFDAVADHESFLRSSDGVHTTILKPGTTDRNGLGCMREVKVGRRMRYLEEITSFERPSSFEYLIRESSQPLRHHGSRVRFIPRGEGTEVDWSGRIEIPVPLVGRALERLTKRMLTAGFTELLLAAKARLEAGHEERTG